LITNEVVRRRNTVPGIFDKSHAGLLIILFTITPQCGMTLLTIVSTVYLGLLTIASTVAQHEWRTFHPTPRSRLSGRKCNPSWVFIRLIEKVRTI
jgi:hypothetical protein